MKFEDFIKSKSEIETKLEALVVREWRNGAKSECEVRRNPEIQNLQKKLKKIEREFFGSELEFC